MGRKQRGREIGGGMARTLARLVIKRVRNVIRFDGLATLHRQGGSICSRPFARRKPTGSPRPISPPSKIKVPPPKPQNSGLSKPKCICCLLALYTTIVLQFFNGFPRADVPQVPLLIARHNADAWASSTAQEHGRGEKLGSVWEATQIGEQIRFWKSTERGLTLLYRRRSQPRTSVRFRF